MITLYYDSNKRGKELKVATKKTLKIKKKHVCLIFET